LATIGATPSFSDSAVSIFSTIVAVRSGPTVVSASIRTAAPVFPLASIGL
jgi:hypothetical protein